jgi:hypothetical protein
MPMSFPFTLSLSHMPLHLLPVSLSLFRLSRFLASLPISDLSPSLTRGLPPLSLTKPHSQPVTSTASMAPVTSLLINVCPTLCRLCYIYAVPLLCPDPWLPDLAREKWVFSPIRVPPGLPFPTFVSFTSHVLKSSNP